MGLDYRRLDGRTRALMLDEVAIDVAAGTLYISENLSRSGATNYESLLKEAIHNGTDDSLAEAVRPRLNSHEKPRRLPSGALSKAPEMRSNAHTMLAEGEFNRFYVRAVCRRSIEDGVSEVTVYRAKTVSRPRPESEQKIGTRVVAETLLNDLRARPGVETALRVPGGPNSGLSVDLLVP